VLAAERFGLVCCCVALACMITAKHAQDRGEALPLNGGHHHDGRSLECRS
jgi:NADH:ubiquinone oxidoreductase subunit B-like Fe-S oxidoreductase